jgi:hypothetical protein
MVAPILLSAVVGGGTVSSDRVIEREDQAGPPERDRGAVTDAATMDWIED